MNFNLQSFNKLKLKNVYFNYPLSKITTIGIGGKCNAMVKVNSIKEIKKVIKFCNKNNVKYFIVGNGSNLLFEDYTFNGIIIKISSNFSSVKFCSKKNNKIVVVKAGNSLMLLNKLCAKNGASGLEFSYGIPASVGGAIYMNAGSFGKSFGDLVKWVKVLEINKNKLKVKKYTKKLCNFNYRQSIFQKINCVILSAKLVFNKDTQENIIKQMQENFNKKKNSQPLGTKNCGCVYKNYKDFKIAKLIEDLNLKGKSVGNAQISNIHSSFIVNKSNASCQNVKDLIKYTQNKIKKVYGFTPELEIEIID